MTGARLRAMPGHGSLGVSDWVARWAPRVVPGGEVLDLACGAGRHARFFAARGHPVLALDRDAAALSALEGVAGVETRVADLEGGRAWPLPGRQFAAVVVTNYLHRPLFGLIAQALAPDGVLVYETFMRGNERFGKPSNPEFLLNPGELLQAFGQVLEIVAFEQGLVERPGPAVVQRLVARSRAATGAGPVSLGRSGG